MIGKLYLVGTPIGNMKDITYRAIETLKSVDVIACEDTRHSMILLNYYDIKKPLVSYYMHKERESGAKIINMLLEGKNVALITDAGMPCVSDPGAILVKMARENGVDCTVVPGASAVVSAMALSGIDKKGFCFLGFLPSKNKDRLELLSPYKNIDIQLVFYSSPHDINDDLDFLFGVFGERNVYIIKEITKMFERVEIGTLGKIKVDEPKGEFVLIVEGEKVNSLKLDLSILEHLKENMASGLSKKDAIKLTAKERGLPKDVVYKESLKID